MEDVLCHPKGLILYFIRYILLINVLCYMDHILVVAVQLLTVDL